MQLHSGEDIRNKKLKQSQSIVGIYLLCELGWAQSCAKTSLYRAGSSNQISEGEFVRNYKFCTTELDLKLWSYTECFGTWLGLPTLMWQIDSWHIHLRKMLWQHQNLPLLKHWLCSGILFLIISFNVLAKQ